MKIQSGAGTMPIKPKLNVDEILKAEYEYIATTVFQANEDRSRVASFYFLSVGSLVAAILSAIFSTRDLKNVSLAFFGLFAALTILGAVTIAQLARLRAAWHESVEAMNEIKDYYIKHNKEIEPAFKWRLKTLPPTDKPYSIANLMAVEVALLGAITSAVSVYFLLTALGSVAWWGWVLLLVTLVAGYIALWTWYKFLLVDNQ
jgi:MFS family permease